MFRSLSTAVLLLLFALPGLALAQGTGTLAGRVVDATTGETLPGANVRIDGTTLGAATNATGEYRIIGVPIGTYTITASFIGFQPQTVTEVTINNGYTRDLSFELSSATLGEVVVEYRRPLITRDAIGTPRVVGNAELQNLPLRGVNEVAAIQASTVSPEGSGDLFIRGGREQEVEYFVDGVRVINPALIGVGQNAIEEQEMIIGTIPARYGDAQSGIINITTRTGRQEFFGNAEFLTSQGLDSFGYNLGALALGGPILPGRLGFFVSAQYEDEADASPFYVDTYRLNDDAYQGLLAQPQALRTINDATGETGFVRFPANLDPSGRTLAQIAQLVDLPDGFRIASGGLVSAGDTFTENDFELSRSKDDPRTNLSLNGNLNLTPGASTQLRLGGGLANRDENLYRFAGSLYNPNSFYHQQRDTYRGYLTLRQRLGNTAFFQLQGEYQDYQFKLFPNGYAGDIEETLFYGDVDAPITSEDYVGASANFYTFNAVNANGQQVYARQFVEDGVSLPGTVGSLFDNPGRRLQRYQQRHDQQLRFTGSMTAQLGVHQLEVGTEFQRETRRFIDLNSSQLSRYFADGSVEGAAPGVPASGVTQFSDLSYAAFEGASAIVSRYGYDIQGNETDDQNIDQFYNIDANGIRGNTNVAAYEPLYYAGYIQDKIEYRDLVLQLGLRVDVFDNNSLVLEDIFAPVQIVRLRDQGATLADGTPIFPQQAPGFSVPSSIPDDAAVYFGDGGTVVGYRDLDGTFYDREGLRTLAENITQSGGGSVITRNDLPRSAAFQDYEAGVIVMPRIGVSFPVTDRALFFASYNVTGQRPTEFAFAPFTDYQELSGQDQRVANPTLRPEQTTQYEIGFRQRVGENVALTVSGFVRNQTNKISNRRLTGGFPAYGTYLNSDFTTSKGVELGFDLRRTRNLSMNANYTLAFAEGTGSDAGATATIVWRGNFFPNTLSPADFDQRHTANVSVDYRFAAGEGPMVGGVRLLENFGINVLGQFGSGLRYTALAGPSSIFDSFTEPTVGTINSSTLPATSRVDLRLDRTFTVTRGTTVRAYATVQNLFDTENVLAAYRATGLPDTDGFLASPDGAVYLSNAPDAAGREFLYSTYVSGQDNLGGSQSSGGGSFYGAPRRIRLGVLFDF